MDATIAWLMINNNNLELFQTKFTGEKKIVVFWKGKRWKQRLCFLHSTYDGLYNNILEK